MRGVRVLVVVIVIGGGRGCLLVDVMGFERSCCSTEHVPAASAWLSVCLFESYLLESCCWVVLVSAEVMAGGCGVVVAGVVAHRKKC